MDKSEYILRSLSKIKHKRWELFVVSRIVHGLVVRDEDIEFVCQQLVRFADGRRALTDMFFPQFGIFLEIDEPHHSTDEQSTNDRLRTDDIINTTKLTERRIAIYRDDEVTPKTVSEVAQETDSFLKEIQTLKQSAISKGDFSPWDFEKRYDPSQHLERGFLSISTNPIFRYQHHALRCFGYTKGIFQRGAWTLTNDPSRSVWFPRLYETDTWDNELTSDGLQIVERKKDDNGGYDKLTYREQWKSRIVFARYSDNLGAVLYRFVGEFSHDPNQSDDYKRVFVRVAERVSTISGSDDR